MALVADILHYRMMYLRRSTFAALVAAVVLAPALAYAQAASTAPNTLPPGLGSGGVAASPAEGRIDPGKAGGKPAFKELRIDNQTGALNSFVRVGPPVNGQGQESAESRSTGSAAASNSGSASERRGPELFKLGGNIKF
jgi:hypothetical protein